MQLYIDNMDAINKIISTVVGSHHNHVVDINCRIMFDPEDIISYLKEQVIKGLHNFNPNKSKLSTFVFTICIRNIRTYYTQYTSNKYSGYFPKDKKTKYGYKPTVNIESFLVDGEDISDHFNYLSISDNNYVKDIPEEIFRICRSHVTDRKADILKIYELYYINNLSINSIADIMGKDLRMVDNIITVANKKLKHSKAAKELI